MNSRNREFATSLVHFFISSFFLYFVHSSGRRFIFHWFVGSSFNDRVCQFVSVDSKSTNIFIFRTSLYTDYPNSRVVFDSHPGPLFSQKTQTFQIKTFENDYFIEFRTFIDSSPICCFLCLQFTFKIANSQVHAFLKFYIFKIARIYSS